MEKNGVDDFVSSAGSIDGCSYLFGDLRLTQEFEPCSGRVEVAGYKGVRLMRVGLVLTLWGGIEEFDGAVFQNAEKTEDGSAFCLLDGKLDIALQEIPGLLLEKFIPIA